jgi:hypothetical protein
LLKLLIISAVVLLFLQFIIGYQLNSDAISIDENNCSGVLAIKNITAKGDDGHVPRNVNDGNLSTWWSDKGTGSWIRLDVGTNKTICSINIAGLKGNERHYNFDILTSKDGTTFTKSANYTSSGTTLNPEKYSIYPTLSRFIEVLVRGNTQIESNTLKNFSSISEISVYGKNESRNGENGMKNQTKIEGFPSIWVTTDDNSYSQGEKVIILGRVHNGSEFSSETITLRVTKTDNVTGWVMSWRYSPVEERPIVNVSTRSDASGMFNYNFSLQDDGRYQVDAFATPSGKKVSATSIFETKNIIFSNSAKMIYWAIIFFVILIIVIAVGNHMYGSISTPTEFRLKQKGIANIELFRFISLTGIAAFLILAFVFADAEIGVNSPVGLVKQNFNIVNQTDIQNSLVKENAWVINIGGSQSDNYIGGIQIPTYVVIFGLLGGYLRYLYGMRFFFSRWKKGDEFEDTDKNWGDLNISDNLSFLRHSLRSLSLFFLSPMLAVVIWFILFQSGTTGKWAIAAVSFSLGLITEEVIQVIISFVRKVLAGIKEETHEKKEDSKVKIMRTVPADGSSGVSVFTDILASFEVPVEKESIDRGFKLVVEKGKGNEPVLGTVTKGSDNLTYRFIPKERLEPDKTYVASIEDVVDLAGRPCEPKTWLFSTRDKPRVLDIKIEKENNLAFIVVDFSEPVDKQSLDDNLLIKEKQTGNRIDGGINVDGKRVTFTPDNQFNAGTEYTVELTKEIKEMAGNNLADIKEWKFKA